MNPAALSPGVEKERQHWRGHMSVILTQLWASVYFTLLARHATCYELEEVGKIPCLVFGSWQLLIASSLVVGLCTIALRQLDQYLVRLSFVNAWIAAIVGIHGAAYVLGLFARDYLPFGRKIMVGGLAAEGVIALLVVLVIAISLRRRGVSTQN